MMNEELNGVNFSAPIRSAPASAQNFGCLIHRSSAIRSQDPQGRLGSAALESLTPDGDGKPMACREQRKDSIARRVRVSGKDPRRPTDLGAESVSVSDSAKSGTKLRTLRFWSRKIHLQYSKNKVNGHD